MAGRISTRTLHDSISDSIAANHQRVLKLQQGIGDGRAVRTPSDDPVRTHLAMRFREQIRSSAQYERNLEGVASNLSATETVLGQISDTLMEVRALQVTGSDDAQGAEGRAAIAEQIEQLTQFLTELANSRFAGIYLFGGRRTLESPIVVERDAQSRIESVSFNPLGVTGDVRRQVTPEVSLTINVSAADLFGEDAGVFDRLRELRDALSANDGETVRSLATEIEAAQERVSVATTSIGSLIGRTEGLLARIRLDQVSYEDGRSKAEDLDVARAIVDFQSEQVALEAALAAGSRILNMSLLDFLR